MLGWSLAATVAFVAVELAAGLRAHSLALLSGMAIVLVFGTITTPREAGN